MGIQQTLGITKIEGKTFNNAVEKKDFPWDQFIIYVSSSILALTVLSVTVEFFMGVSGVSCLYPSNATREQAIFMDQYCTDSLPRTEYFSVYILVHGLLLIIPHYVWSAAFDGDFDSFFLVATNIDCLRDHEVGEYSEENFSRVNKLEKKYGRSKLIVNCFKVKLVAQVLLSIASLGIGGGVFREKFFSFSFNCTLPMDGASLILDEWPENITCVYSRFRILYVAWIVDLFLTALVIILALYGLAWCYWRHASQLGYHSVAEFTFQSFTEPNFYEFPRTILTCENLRRSIYPTIQNDLDFLLLALLGSASIYGEAFRDILVG